MLKSLIFGVVCVFFSVASLFGCDKIENYPTAPERPTSVPKESVWVGGLDGGVFVYLKANTGLPPSGYWGEVYYVSGDVAYKGKFEVIPAEKNDFDLDDPRSYGGWDGDILYLSNGGQLRAVD